MVNFKWCWKHKLRQTQLVTGAFSILGLNHFPQPSKRVSRSSLPHRSPGEGQWLPTAPRGCLIQRSNITTLYWVWFVWTSYLPYVYTCKVIYYFNHSIFIPALLALCTTTLYCILVYSLYRQFDLHITIHPISTASASPGPGCGSSSLNYVFQLLLQDPEV